MSVKKRIERMEKFLLRPLLTTEKLNVVDQKKVGLTITLPELDQITVLNRVDELVDEQFTREVDHLHVFPFRPDELADGLHEMGFAQTDAPINKKRIVRARRCLRDCQTRGMRDFVVRADDERFKCVSRIESGNRRARSYVDWRRRQRLLVCGYILRRRLRDGCGRATELHRTRTAER